jgi:hypothetical protein
VFQTGLEPEPKSDKPNNESQAMRKTCVVAQMQSNASERPKLERNANPFSSFIFRKRQGFLQVIWGAAKLGSDKYD